MLLERLDLIYMCGGNSRLLGNEEILLLNYVYVFFNFQKTIFVLVHNFHNFKTCFQKFKTVCNC